MPNPYIYSIAADLPGGACNSDKLHAEIDASAIATALVGIRHDGDVCTIIFTGDLSAGDKTILDNDTTGPAGGLLAAHDNSASGSGVVNNETLSADKTLTVADAVMQRLDPGGAHRDVILVAEADVIPRPLRIVNTADNTEDLVVKDDGGVTIATLNQNEAAWFACDGTTWFHMGIETIVLS